MTENLGDQTINDPRTKKHVATIYYSVIVLHAYAMGVLTC